MARPEDYWFIEDDYKEAYSRYVEMGRVMARESRLAVLAIARNAMPFMANTLALVEETAGFFAGASAYIYENDSVDDTAAALDIFASRRGGVIVEHDTLGEPDTRGYEPDRTVRLAKCRNKCLEWLAARPQPPDYTLVLDLDPQGGFSPEGILNSLGWIAEYSSSNFMPAVGGMASYSLCCDVIEDDLRIAQYDAWAMRLNWWEDRRDFPGGNVWAHMLLPPIGSHPIPMNSAFGGACLYRTPALLSSRYSGVSEKGEPDCEHVALHRRMKSNGYQMYLNPGSRYIAIMPKGTQWS